MPSRHNQIRSQTLFPSDFAKTGLFVTRHATPATRFQVLGERSSGTNFVKRLLGRNSDLAPTEALGWKHGPNPIAIPADLAVICVLRDPARWALSMHAKPWHSAPDLQALEFPDFIRAPWDTRIDRARYFGGDAAKPMLGQPLLADRDPVTGAMPENLFALRRMKLNILLSYANRGSTCVILRLEAVQAAPERALDQILAALSHPPRKGVFRPVMKRLGAKFKAAIDDRPQTPKAMGKEDLAFMKSQLDRSLEARLGYDL